MTDTTATLVRMANQIAANLGHENDPAAATAEHIRLYWDPRMKRAIAALRGEGRRARYCPTPQPSSNTRPAARGPAARRIISRRRACPARQM